MKPYPLYKDSGVEWICEIPSGWKLKKLKYQSEIKFSSVDRHLKDGERVIFVCHYPDVYHNEKINHSIGLNRGSCSEQEYENYRLKKDDVIITKDSESPDDIGVPTYIELDLENVVCGYHLCQISTDKGGLLGGYLFRFIQSDKTCSYFENNSNGITRFGLGKPKIENLYTPVPPLPEQQQISNYLDQKTKQIDDLIEKTEQKIELLREKRTSLINHCVTKGLDPNVEMKDSGVEWIGEIPNGWKVMKGKYILKVLTGNYPNELIEDEKGVTFIKVDDLNNRIDDYYLDKSKSCVQRDDSTIPLERNILLFPKRGMTIFTNKIVICRVESFIDPNLMGVKVFQNSDIKFILFVIKNRGLGDICDSSTIPQINNKHIYPLEFPFPPLPEQQQIVNHLDQETKKIDTLMEKENKRIDLLKEYRQSFISEVVTGKIDVRDEVLQ